MNLDNLHPDIKQDLEEMNRKPVEVIDPSPGLWGGDPVPGLVTIVYECDNRACGPGCSDFTAGHTAHQPTANPEAHTHHALYGPTEERGSEGMTLYAD